MGFVVSMLLGRVFGGVFGFEYIDSGMDWAGAADYLKNLGNILVGYWLLLGGMPDVGIVRSATSFTGFVYCFGIVISLVFTIAIIYWLVKTIHTIKNKEEVNNNILFLLMIIVVNIFMFSFLAPWAISEVFSVRYLVPSTIAGFLLMDAFIEDLDTGLILRKVGVVVLFASIVCMDLYSDYFLAITDNSSWQADELLDVIDDTDAGLVYFWDNGKTLVEPERVLRVIDTTRVYKCISNGSTLEDFGDYSYYDDSTEYDGATIIVTYVDDIAAPDDIISQYELIATVGDYGVYYCADNPVDLQAVIE